MAVSVKKAWNFILDLLFPPRCAVCDDVVPIGPTLCDDCARALADRNFRTLCMECREERENCGCPDGPRVLCVVPFVYAGTVRKAIHAYKFESVTGLCAPFSHAMADSINRLGLPEFDVVCPVPMSGEWFAERGFDHTMTLARQLGERLDVPCDPLLEKRVDNLPQRTLSAAERRKNVRGVYGALDQKEIFGENILLCDDVVTTGSTLRECVRVLKKAGAESVYCVAVAATVRPEEEDIDT